MGSIYIIKNIINNKSYIGQTIQNFERRVQCHFWEANRKEHEESKLNRAILKYGKENFIWKVIINCEKEDLNDKEIFYIKIFNSFNLGYNSTIGGQGTSNKKVTDKTKTKIRNFQIKYNSNPKIKERKKNQMLGKNHHQYNKLGLNNKNFGLVRKKTLENIDTIVEIRNKKYQGIKSKELSILYNKCIKTIDNWCGPDFEKYGGPTTTNYSIKQQSENRRKKLVMNRAVNRLDGDGSEEISLSPMKA
jgi:group I intron endonuclease